MFSLHTFFHTEKIYLSHVLSLLDKQAWLKCARCERAICHQVAWTFARGARAHETPARQLGKIIRHKHSS